MCQDGVVHQEERFLEAHHPPSSRALRESCRQLTAALDLIEATYEREVAPGELVTVGPDGALTSTFPLPPAPPAKCVFEHIYFAAVESSCECAQQDGPYETFAGSPMSQGIFQYDMWNTTPLTLDDGTLDWEDLKARVKAHGVRNSLLMAPMPTASTSQILGFNECIEPFTSNIYTRRTLAGEFIVINKHLMRDLEKLGIWSEMMKQQIIARNGSVQGIDQVPESIQKLDKTSWEIKQKTLIDLSVGRGAFICQSQSLNLFVADPNYARLTSMHFYAWKKGLKTGVYYLRTKTHVMAQKFTVDPELQKEAEKSEAERQEALYKADEGCVMCSS
jgi:ribonucleoside-diphosphate reductase alpha chain